MTQAAYDASIPGKRALKLWRPPNAGPNIGGSADQTVTRNRDLARNNPWAGAANDRSVSAGIGHGIMAKQVHGGDALRAQVAELWKRFCAHSDPDGVLCFDAQCKIAWIEERDAGEVFARIRPRREEDGLPVPMQVQLIESEQCPRSHNSIAPNGNEIREGIEFTRFGRRAAYWMYPRHPGDYSPMSGFSAGELRRIPADQVLHFYAPTRAGQIRGIPRGVAAMISAWSMDRILESVRQRLQIGNLLTGFFTRGVGADPAPVLGEVVTHNDETDDVPIAGLEPGTMQELPAGVDVKFSVPPATGPDAVAHIRQELLAFCAANGVPYEVVTGDLTGVSDRALKLILQEFHRLVDQHRWLHLLPQFCQPIRAAFWDAAVLGGQLRVSDYAARREWYQETEWVPHGFPYSHPVQDVNADVTAVKAGFESRSGIALRRGNDPEAIDAEQEQDNARAELLGLVYDTDTSARNVPTQGAE